MGEVLERLQAFGDIEVREQKKEEESCTLMLELRWHFLRLHLKVKNVESRKEASEIATNSDIEHPDSRPKTANTSTWQSRVQAMAEWANNKKQGQTVQMRRARRRKSTETGPDETIPKQRRDSRGRYPKDQKVPNGVTFIVICIRAIGKATMDTGRGQGVGLLTAGPGDTKTSPDAHMAMRLHIPDAREPKQSHEEEIIGGGTSSAQVQGEKEHTREPDKKASQRQWNKQEASTKKSKAVRHRDQQRGGSGKVWNVNTGVQSEVQQWHTRKSTKGHTSSNRIENINLPGVDQEERIQSTSMQRNMSQKKVTKPPVQQAKQNRSLQQSNPGRIQHELSRRTQPTVP
ncbi:hypothetical protein Tco_0857482 [Tanacetum coccineum]|uniref:Uncharacterized protein n=1 Tax=Tanacetum coccineum TaxID=301880 RepID=A0ABQ5B6C3_9ASTR